MSGANFTKKNLEKSSAYVHGTCVVSYFKEFALEKHSSPTHLIQTSFFSSITVFSVKNVVLCDPYLPFRIQPSVALEAGKNILHSIRQQLLIRYVL